MLYNNHQQTFKINLWRGLSLSITFWICSRSFSTSINSLYSVTEYKVKQFDSNYKRNKLVLLYLLPRLQQKNEQTCKSNMLASNEIFFYTHLYRREVILLNWEQKIKYFTEIDTKEYRYLSFQIFLTSISNEYWFLQWNVGQVPHFVRDSLEGPFPGAAVRIVLQVLKVGLYVRFSVGWRPEQFVALRTIKGLRTYQKYEEIII